MVDRVVLEGDRLQNALRSEDWKQAVSIWRRIGDPLKVLARGAHHKSRPRVQPGANGLADVPLTVVAHDEHMDRRTAESRLKKCGVPIQRWPEAPRIAMVNRAAAVQALRSFARTPRGKG
jgi:hypothetical protein